MKILLLIPAIIIMTMNLPAQHFKAIIGGTIINTEDNTKTENSVILIKDSVIVAAGEKIKGKIPENAEIINADGKYIIPGLVDGHIHFFQSGGLYTRPDGLDLRHRVPYEQELSWIRDNIDDVFRRYIRCGVTSVMDMGGPFWNFDIREQARNTAIAPRTYVTGPLIASYQPEALTTDDPPIIKVTTVAEALDLVRKEADMGADYIKIWYVVSKGTSTGLEEFYPIVKAIVKESHKLGLKVWVHATELETARKAVEAGCDVLVHSVTDKEVDENFLQLCKKRNIILIPTLWVFESYAAVYSKKLDLLKEEHLLGNPKVIGTLFDMYELSYDELGERQKKLLIDNKPVKINPVILKNLKKMYDYGITIAAGTDAGNVGVIHGPAIYHDFKLMSEAGIPYYDIIKCATLNGAKLVDKQDKLGSIEGGKLADMVVLNSDPTENISNVSDINMIFLNGKKIMPEEALPVSPEDLVQIQLNAYNAKDLEAFLPVYDPEVEVYSFPDSLLYKGRDKMKKLYTVFFAKAGILHCKLINRITRDNFVIDRELVTTGIPGRDSITAIAMYEIRNGLIKKVWFIQ